MTFAQQPDGTWNALELFQSTPGLHYEDAVNAAVAVGGHLFTPRSRMENAAGAGMLTSSAWIGLDDTDAGLGEGNWSLVDDGAGRELVWLGLGTDAGGAPVAGKYHNWNGGGEPNDFPPGEDAGELLPNGRWNDLPSADPGVTRNFIVEFPTALAAQPDPAPGLSQATTGAWNIRRINGAPEIQNARGVEMMLYSGLGTTADYQAPTINFRDQNSGDGLVGGGSFFPGDDPGNADENFFSLYARGRIQIDEEDDYTFGFFGDDGAELRVHGQNFISSTNIGDGGNVNLLESNLPAAAHDGDRIAYPNPTGSGSVLGVVHLTPGTYDLTYTWYENGGGAHAEVFAARGAHASFDSAAFRAIGHQAGPDTVVPGVTGDGWQVWTTPPGGAELTTLAQASAELNDYIAGGALPAQHNAINFNDPGFGGPGRIGGDVPFEGDTAADDNDFAVFATATLVVPADGVYRIGFQGDDGGEFGFVDTSVSFTSLIENATGLSTINGGFATGYDAGLSNAIVCDCLTGDSSTVGEVALTAGEYEVYAGFWERAGGAYFEVFAGGPNSQLVLLAAGGASITPDFDGLQLVPEPSSFVLAGLGVIGLLTLRRRRRD